jgi:hypothetical protein
VILRKLPLSARATDDGTGFQTSVVECEFAKTGNTTKRTGTMINDPVRTLKLLRRGDKMARKCVEAEFDGARFLAEAVKKFGADDMRRGIGEEAFDRFMGLAKRLEELGEEEFKRVRFLEFKAAAGFDPNQN